MRRGADRTRPVFPYPLTAKYTGTGSVDDARNFVAESPEPAPVALLNWLESGFYAPHYELWCTGSGKRSRHGLQANTLADVALYGESEWAGLQAAALKPHEFRVDAEIPWASGAVAIAAGFVSRRNDPWLRKGRACLSSSPYASLRSVYGQGLPQRVDNRLRSHPPARLIQAGNQASARESVLSLEGNWQIGDSMPPSAAS